jgi:Na+-transporting methylmalonyl-CoA/oxaloacetate decarboxylase gamma subunit
MSEDSSAKHNSSSTVIGVALGLLFLVAVAWEEIASDIRQREHEEQQEQHYKEEWSKAEKEKTQRVAAIKEYIHNQLRGVAKDATISDVNGDIQLSSNAWHEDVYPPNEFTVNVEYVRLRDGKKRKVRLTVYYPITHRQEIEIRKCNPNFPLKINDSFVLDPETGKIVEGFHDW